MVPATAEEMQSYKYEEIQDAAMGKVVARCMIPSDYAAAGQVTWCGQWQSAGARSGVYHGAEPGSEYGDGLLFLCGL